jgi:hypothetical protein
MGFPLPYFTPSHSPWDEVLPIQGESSPFYLILSGNPAQTHTEVCYTNPGTSQSNQIENQNISSHLQIY